MSSSPTTEHVAEVLAELTRSSGARYLRPMQIATVAGEMAHLVVEALEELVADGRADRDLSGGYRARVVAEARPAWLSVGARVKPPGGEPSTVVDVGDGHVTIEDDRGSRSAYVGRAADCLAAVTIADPDSDDDPAEGDVVIVEAEVVPETPQSPVVAELLEPVPCPAEKPPKRLCWLPGFRWEERTDETGLRLVRVSDGWIAGTTERVGSMWSWVVSCGDMRGRGSIDTGKDAATEWVVRTVYRRRKDWPEVAAAEPSAPPATIEDLARKWSTDPVGEVLRARGFVADVATRRERLVRAIAELEEARDVGVEALAELDRMMGGGK